MSTVKDMYQNQGIDVPNLCLIVANHLEFVVGKTESKIFLADPGIKAVWDDVPVVQRVALNRFFNNLLMKFRAKKPVAVHDTAYMLIHDGTINDWYSSFSMSVGPFLKTHNVFGVVYGQD